MSDVRADRERLERTALAFWLSEELSLTSHTEAVESAKDFLAAVDEACPITATEEQIMGGFTIPPTERENVMMALTIPEVRALVEAARSERDTLRRENLPGRASTLSKYLTPFEREEPRRGED